MSVCENQYLRITRLIKVQIRRTLWHPCSTHLRPFHHRPSLRELNNQQASFHHHPPDHLLLRLRVPYIQQSWLSLSWFSLFGLRPSHHLLTVQPPSYQPPNYPFHHSIIFILIILIFIFSIISFLFFFQVHIVRPTFFQPLTTTIWSTRIKTLLILRSNEIACLHQFGIKARRLLK